MTRFEFGVSGSADRAAWDAAGGGAADVATALLRSLGYDTVFTAPPGADPIVLAAGEFARDARQANGAERGTLPVGLTVCCDDPRHTEATAHAVERDLRLADWTGENTGWRVHVVAVDTTAPGAGSGRLMRR